MKRLSFGRLINARIGIPGVRTDVAHMSQDVTLGVLRPRRPEMRANSAKDRGGKLLTVDCHRETADHLQADAIKQRLLQRLEVRAKQRQREFFSRDLADFLRRRQEYTSRLLELCDLRGGELHKPAIGRCC